MTISRQWTITQLDYRPSYNGLTNVVSKIQWECNTASPGIVGISTHGLTYLGEPNPANFIPYAELTSDTIMAWISVDIGEHGLMSLHNKGYNFVMSHITPQEPVALPWSTV